MATTVAVTTSRPQPQVRGGARAELAIGRQTLRRTWIGATVCAIGFGLTVASSAVTYATTFPDEATRQEIARTTGGDIGFAILLGPTSSLDTVGGYTFYKGFVFLTTIAAVWALLVATRSLRGEEDAGRWQLVLSGATRPGRATGAAMAGLGVAIAIVVAGTTLVTALVGRNPDVGFGLWPSVLYGLSLAIPLAFFAAAGALVSQLTRSRRLANGVGAAILGLAFLLRMVGDAGPSFAWVRWLTPFGWSELTAAFTVNDAAPLLPAAVTVAAMVVATIVLAGHRDVGDGLLASRDVAELRPAGLGSTFGLATRLDLGVLVGWCVGVAASGLMLGIVSKLTLNQMPSSMADLLDKFGATGTFVRQFFGICFLLVATVVCLLPAGQLSAAAEEETSGRLVHILSRRPSRTGWFAGRLALTAIAIVVASVLGGLATWIGAVTQGVDIGFGELVGAGLNVAPTALLVLGLGAVVLALWPRAASITVYVVVGWSVIIDILASLITGADWLGRTSVFHYLALAPADAVSATTVAVTLGVAVVLAVVATALFARRDLSTG